MITSSMRRVVVRVLVMYVVVWRMAVVMVRLIRVLVEQLMTAVVARSTDDRILDDSSGLRIFCIDERVFGFVVAAVAPADDVGSCFIVNDAKMGLFLIGRCMCTTDSFNYFDPLCQHVFQICISNLYSWHYFICFDC